MGWGWVLVPEARDQRETPRRFDDGSELQDDRKPHERALDDESCVHHRVKWGVELSALEHP